MKLIKGSKKQHNFIIVKGLLRNKDISKKSKLGILKIYFKKISLYGAETWTTTERKAKFKPWKLNF